MTSGFGESGQAGGGGGSFPGYPAGFGIAGLSLFDEVSPVAKNTPTEIISYTVPDGKNFYLQLVEVGGDNIGQYTVTVGATVLSVMRTWFNGPFIERARFDGVGNLGFVIPTGSILSVSVTHSRPADGKFESRIVGVLF
jgi:hypothetical protein